MTVVVCLKLVSQSSFADTLSSDSDNRLSGQLAVNPADEYALELALRMKQACRDVQVIVLSMSPMSAEFTLRRALAMGADEAYLICDKRLAGSDTLVTSQVLAQAIRMFPRPDLILCGQKSIDSETGHIGPQLSVHLELPVVTNVATLRLSDAAIYLERAQDNGLVQLQCTAPAILTICRGTEMVRVPGLRGIREAQKKTIHILTHESLQLTDAQTGKRSPTRVVQAESVSYRKRTGLRAEDPAAGANAIVDLIRKCGDVHG